MLSILIPTYNYKISTLVKTLYQQALNTNCVFEILVLDDCSTDTGIISSNAEINLLPNCRIIQNDRNLGRTAARQRLAETATYETLLFLDADVMPKNSNFIENYLDELTKTESEVIFGGIAYQKEKPETNKMLRWKYGVERESLTVATRQKNPFLTVNSGAFLIQKKIFLKINGKMNLNNYGMDIMFTQLLKEKCNGVLHIENPVLHLGLEDNEVFIKKSLKAVETLVILENENKIESNLSTLQRSYLKLKKLHLREVFSFIISKMKGSMERNFLSNNPNLFWFDLYRLHYYIQLKNKTNA